MGVTACELRRVPHMGDMIRKIILKSLEAERVMRGVCAQKMPDCIS